MFTIGHATCSANSAGVGLLGLEFLQLLGFKNLFELDESVAAELWTSRIDPQ